MYLTIILEFAYYNKIGLLNKYILLSLFIDIIAKVSLYLFDQEILKWKIFNFFDFDIKNKI